MPRSTSGLFLFFFNDTATTEIYTLSLHDALPISLGGRWASAWRRRYRHDALCPEPQCGSAAAWPAWRESAPATYACAAGGDRVAVSFPDRKSTRLNSSHT